jgi:excisionase family DNA binding protein
MDETPHKATAPAQSVHTSDEWITRSEAASLLRVAPRTFDRWRQDGRITRYTTPGSHPRYLRSDVLALITPPQEDDAAAS